MKSVFKDKYDIFLIFISCCLIFYSITETNFFDFWSIPKWFINALSIPKNNGGFFYSYQTLISGILAIAAAIIGGSCVLKAAKYPYNLEALSEARRYVENMMGVVQMLSDQIKYIEQTNFDKINFFARWDIILRNTGNIKPITIHLLALTGLLYKFNFFLNATHGTLLKLQDGTLNPSSDRDFILKDLKKLQEETLNCLTGISEQCKKFERKNIARF